jgi:hypothetical protein
MNADYSTVQTHCWAHLFSLVNCDIIKRVEAPVGFESGYATEEISAAAVECVFPGCVGRRFVFIFRDVVRPYRRYKRVRTLVLQIVPAIRDSQPLMALFKQKAEELLRDDHKMLDLVQHVPTRWLSEYALGR